MQTSKLGQVVSNHIQVVVVLEIDGQLGKQLRSDFFSAVHDVLSDVREDDRGDTITYYGIVPQKVMSNEQRAKELTFLPDGIAPNSKHSHVFDLIIKGMSGFMTDALNEGAQVYLKLSAVLVEERNLGEVYVEVS